MRSLVLILVLLAAACESATDKAQRLRTAAALACLPPLDSMQYARLRDSTDSTNGARSYEDSAWRASHPEPTEAERLAAAAARCDAATREYNAFLAGR